MRMLMEVTKRQVTDFLTESGAVLLAESIRRYWAERGRNPPQMRLEPFYSGKGLTSGGREGKSYVPGRTFAVRSDMVGGWPKKHYRHESK